MSSGRSDQLFELLPERSSTMRSETLTVRFSSEEVTGDLLKSSFCEMVEMKDLLEWIQDTTGKM